MDRYAVEFSRRAHAQIRSIFSHIAQDNPDAALKMVDSLEKNAQYLGDMPYMGVELPLDEYPFLPQGYRRLIVNPFVMYYRIVGQTVYITHIIHTKRNQANALAEG